MPLITERQAVLNVYAGAAQRGWVVPTFCTENLTTTEAILAATHDYARRRDLRQAPVCVAITNLYSHRSQSVNYTHTRQWQTGLKLFLADLAVLAEPPSPFAGLDILVHLDHVQWDADTALLEGDLSLFSSIMYDASSLPIRDNIARTADFMARRGKQIVVEGACDEIVDAGGQAQTQLTSPETAREYAAATGVDFVVANLGTEHRASAADLKYHGDAARQISRLIGPKLVLHGASSVSGDHIRTLFADGVRKVNIWTTLERDSAPAMLTGLLKNAGKVVGPAEAEKLYREGLLGERADRIGPRSLSHFATCARQQTVFEAMKRIVGDFLELFYV